MTKRKGVTVIILLLSSFGCGSIKQQYSFSGTIPISDQSMCREIVPGASEFVYCDWIDVPAIQIYTCDRYSCRPSGSKCLDKTRTLAIDKSGISHCLTGKITIPKELR